jgi:hypothetical protein
MEANIQTCLRAKNKSVVGLISRELCSAAVYVWGGDLGILCEYFFLLIIIYVRWFYPCRSRFFLPVGNQYFFEHHTNNTVVHF